ncbi:MAG: DCC1-like thiol-disulfide oxidoreductase family protein [Gammaproteobacteria bacterium]|jgi:predicted DCC family thiol-disulfide oxidoreductase YuxK|nr:DCC1-like thiol-disulfide oxidoreductase family protein [Gammaproteobacteria bacterium]MDH3888245.1 DCC1-like thiol-disulfide oxidoreductase family protein [Gammaproteobacteria bacterium]MDH3970633.1 DCC1-like thiol-disulfide oxidoreductase family protein [Gammaproteobacteria bacterium]MDH3986153.1 DCC1-like thiol-disulfide oxidoreductase family protein [Gammaproteobacteria bacterium]
MNDDPIILFDGVCHLCVGSVQFVIKRDPHKRFRFARLQSKVAQQILSEQAAGDTGLDSVILIYKGRLHRKSRAVLHIALLLQRAWPVMGIFLLVPRFIADPVYDYVGRHRYQWFGKKESCWLPESGQRLRFLDMNEHLE